MGRFDSIIDRMLDVQMHSGPERYAVCPFHSDSNPSFAINSDSGLWLCHGCGEKGNIDGLTRRLLGDVEVLSSSLDSIIDRINALREAPDDHVQPHLPEEWLLQFSAPTEYWSGRGISEQWIKEFGLGFDPITQYATIPLRDIEGNLIGIIKRATHKRQKVRYIYPTGFQAAQDMFASWRFHRTAFSMSHAVLVEGPLDTIACWEAGHPALGLYGAKISTYQVALLRSMGIRSVTLCMDNDEAGRRASRLVKLSLPGILAHVPRQWPRTAKDPLDLDPEWLSEVLSDTVPVFLTS